MRQAFGTLADGRQVDIFRLGSLDGMMLDILSYGAIVHSMTLPMPEGRRELLASLPTLKAYEADTSYRNCIIGRTVNRISHAAFDRADQHWALTVNDLPHALHGGQIGFNRHIWKVTKASSHELSLEHVSPHLDQGYPGKLHVSVTFEVEAQRLSITYVAEVDRPCPVDLTHHLYFNLGVAGARDILDHLVSVKGEKVIALNPDFTPTGTMLPVRGTPFDINTLTSLANMLSGQHSQLTSIGLNQAWVLDKTRPALRLQAPDRSIGLILETNAPALQLYSGLGRYLYQDGALAVEPQGYTDAVNIPHFPSPWIEPAYPFRRKSVYKLSTSAGH